MKKKKLLRSGSFLTVLFYLMLNPLFSQNFSWMKGSNSAGAYGSYGGIGISNSSNNPSGRFCGTTWTDANNGLWLFGGHGMTSCGPPDAINDLWKYDITTDNWTWYKGGNDCSMQGGIYGTLGAASSNNTPGGRAYAMNWSDLSGNLWLYGGQGNDGAGGFGSLSDLWQYDISTDMWTWVAGPNISGGIRLFGAQGVPGASTTPGPVQGSATWTDANGDFWLYGGSYNYALSNSSAMWKYTISTNKWTWMQGDSTINAQPVYGPQGIFSAPNTPGARIGAVSWVDNAGKFWLFGGNFVYNGSMAQGNDLWKYDPQINQWAWINGNSPTNHTNYSDHYPNFCIQGISSPAALPGARYRSTGVKDAQDNLWLFGGIGLMGPAGGATLSGVSDTWRYNIANGQWAWVKGSNLPFQYGIYGVQTVTAAANCPGGREGPMSWIDQSGNVWIFGGVGTAASQIGFTNDLWKLERSCEAPIVSTTAKGCVACGGQTQTITASGALSYSWSTGQQNTNSIVISPTAVTTITLSSTSQNNCVSDFTFTIDYVMSPPPVITITSPQTICVGQSLTLTASGAGTYQWFHGQAPSEPIITPTATAMYSVTGNLNGCYASASVNIVVSPCIVTGADEQIADESALIYPNPGNGELHIVNPEMKGNLILMNSLGQQLYSHALSDGINNFTVDLPKGIYFYKMINPSQKAISGKLIIE